MPKKKKKGGVEKRDKKNYYKCQSILVLTVVFHFWNPWMFNFDVLFTEIALFFEMALTLI